MRRSIFLLITVLLSSFAATTTLEISGDTLILSYPDSRSREPVIFRREGGNPGQQVPPMKIDIPGTWTLKTAGDAPDISRNALWPGVVGRNYSYTLRTDKPRAKWSAQGLPEGLNVSSAGKISGRPTESGTFSVDVTAETSAGKSLHVFTLKIFADSKPRIVTASLPEANVNASYDFTLKLNDSPASVIMAGGVPEGLTLNDRGRLYGQPKKAGSYSIDITAANDAGESSSSLALKVSSRDITKPAPKPAPKPKPAPRPRNTLRISTSSMKQAFTDEDYSFTLKAAGSPPITWKADRLPAGLSLDSGTGTVSGRPSEDFKGKITFTAANSHGSVSREVTFSVKTKKPRIITSILPEAFAGSDYSTRLHAEGGRGITWEFRGKIPDGLSFSRSGVIEGIPEKAGRFPLTVYAGNTGGKDSHRFTLKVSENFPHDYVTAAVIPAFMESADGRYDFTVSIDAGVPAGSYMEWHPFPNGVEADGGWYVFTDSSDKETFTIPADHRVTVRAYLDGGVIYEPMITARVRAGVKKQNADKPGRYSGCGASGSAGVIVLAAAAGIALRKA